MSITYQIEADPADPNNSVIVTNSDGREWRIHREDADPEHRFTPYASLPAGLATYRPGTNLTD